MADTLNNGASYNSGGYSNDGSNTNYYNNSAPSYNTSLDPTASRLSISGLIAGAANTLLSGLNVSFLNNIGQVSAENDWRLRVSLSPNTPILYNDSNNLLLAPLRQTSGVVFPYTPQVQIQHTARYGSSQLTHSNYNSYFYEGSEVSAITISGDFTVQNVAEGQYLLSVIYFFRAVTKMFFGNDQYGLQGTPPPIVFLDGYGSHYLPHVPCVVTGFTHTMPADVDYVEIPVYQTISSGVGSLITDIFGTGDTACPTRLPTQSQVSLTFQPIYSRRNIHRNFNVADFANGALIGDPTHRSGNAPPGGFL